MLHERLIRELRAVERLPPIEQERIALPLADEIAMLESEPDPDVEACLLAGLEAHVASSDDAEFAEQSQPSVQRRSRHFRERIIERAVLSRDPWLRARCA